MQNVQPFLSSFRRRGRKQGLSKRSRVSRCIRVGAPKALNGIRSLTDWVYDRIFELTHRTLPALLNTTLIILSPFITTLWDWYWSPMHLIFTYIIPLIPIFYAIDGYVSCARCRTAEETWNLLTEHTGLSVPEWELKNGWELRSGQQVVLPPFGTLYWYTGVKRENL